MRKLISGLLRNERCSSEGATSWNSAMRDSRGVLGGAGASPSVLTSSVEGATGLTGMGTGLNSREMLRRVDLQPVKR
jgi:hypothetical protein